MSERNIDKRRWCEKKKRSFTKKMEKRKQRMKKVSRKSHGLMMPVVLLYRDKHKAT